MGGVSLPLEMFSQCFRLCICVHLLRHVSLKHQTSRPNQINVVELGTGENKVGQSRRNNSADPWFNGGHAAELLGSCLNDVSRTDTGVAN